MKSLCRWLFLILFVAVAQLASLPLHVVQDLVRPVRLDSFRRVGQQIVLNFALLAQPLVATNRVCALVSSAILGIILMDQILAYRAYLDDIQNLAHSLSVQNVLQASMRLDLLLPRVMRAMTRGAHDQCSFCPSPSAGGTRGAQ